MKVSLGRTLISYIFFLIFYAWKIPIDGFCQGDLPSCSLFTIYLFLLSSLNWYRSILKVPSLVLIRGHMFKRGKEGVHQRKSICFISILWFLRFIDLKDHSKRKVFLFLLFTYFMYSKNKKFLILLKHKTLFNLKLIYVKIQSVDQLINIEC